MKEKKRYISLQLKGDNSYHKNGERLNFAERVINIGETADCDVRMDSDGLVPEYYASIICNEDGKSWRIVKRSQHIDINILGHGNIGYAYQLTEGDLIQFDEKPITLCFHSHYDSNYDNDSNKSKQWLWALTIIN